MTAAADRQAQGVALRAASAGFLAVAAGLARVRTARTGMSRAVWSPAATTGSPTARAGRQPAGAGRDRGCDHPSTTGSAPAPSAETRYSTSLSNVSPRRKTAGSVPGVRRSMVVLPHDDRCRRRCLDEPERCTSETVLQLAGVTNIAAAKLRDGLSAHESARMRPAPRVRPTDRPSPPDPHPPGRRTASTPPHHRHPERAPRETPPTGDPGPPSRWSPVTRTSGSAAGA